MAKNEDEYNTMVKRSSTHGVQLRAQSFFFLWLKQIHTRFVSSSPPNIRLADYLRPNEVREMSDVLRRNVGLIDEYLNVVDDMGDRETSLSFPAGSIMIRIRASIEP